MTQFGEQAQKGHRVFANRPRREPVANHQHQIAPLCGGLFVHPLLRGLIEPTTEVGPGEIGGAIQGRAVQAQDRQPQFGQFASQSIHIQGQMHGIAGLGMGHAQAQDRGQGQAGATTAQGNAGIGELPQLLPGVLNHRRSVLGQRCRSSIGRFHSHPSGRASKRLVG
jgi:hypothetical protein